MLQLFETSMNKNSPAGKPVGKAALGQYMTPSNIAAFMASLFPKSLDGFHLLDAGAGGGSLTCAFLDALRNSDSPFPSGKASLFEFDAALVQKLEANTANAFSALSVERHIYHTDFIEHATMLVLRKQRLFTHAILNPPYKKINSSSMHRAFLRDVGIETVNLYTAFVALAVALLRPGGTLVAIIPRSFCNGPYYKPFREFILRHAAIRHIHLFTSRTDAFKADKILQENVILKLERDAEQGDICISTSTNGDMDDYDSTHYSFAYIVRPGDLEKFIHIPDAQDEAKSLSLVNSSLASLGIEVSTGPVVDFRLKEYLREIPQGDDAPLLYSGHFNGKTEWPKAGFKKSNAIACCPETMKWLYPNGYYVIVRRLSSKEEKRRIVAHFVDPAYFPEKPFFGFENHLNVFHCRKEGLDKDVAQGLALYLNSRFVDTIFRRFNGHTQVNATDLRALPYPPSKILAELGVWVKEQKELTQEAVERHLENVLA
ncbi:MAG: Eco57I restriction-modification methylase domain-containing protein [Desulfovibrio sp.]|jgi:tRNA1(Val) A37 N6-methylase TrmN6|nr:Eco57I restriction-modification methylase domain-containing protein [Desulfovibrio sp.]